MLRSSVLFGAFLLLPFAVPSQVHAGEVGDEVIYGDDDRLDLYQVEDTRVLGWARSTVGLFRAGNVTVEGDTAKLRTGSYADDYNLWGAANRY